jgi:L-fucose dehydrogenase
LLLLPAEQGIGRAVVHALAKEQAIPVIVGRKQADNEKVKEEIRQFGVDALCIEGGVI